MRFTLTTLIVKDLDRSLAFYRDVLGMPLITRFAAGAGEIAMLGEQEHAHLELVASGQPVPENPGQGISVGFYVDDAQELIRKIGAPAQGPITPNPHLRFFFMQDPDGYRVQLLEKTA